MTPRKILAANVARQMQLNPALSTPEKLARRCYWTHGRRRGKRVAERTIRYVLDARDDSPSPSLDLIVAIAAAFKCQPWDLVTPP